MDKEECLEETEAYGNRSLLQRLKAGEDAAYETLLHDQQSPLYRYFLFHTGNRDFAEDLVCETFAVFVKSLPRLHDEALNLRAYLFGIARNKMHESNRAHTLPLLSDELLEQMHDSSNNPRDWAITTENLRLVWQAMDELTDEAKQVMLLRYVEEMSLKEISEIQSLPLNTVKSIVHRSVLCIRKILQSKGVVIHER